MGTKRSLKPIIGKRTTLTIGSSVIPGTVRVVPTNCYSGKQNQSHGGFRYVFRTVTGEEFPITNRGLNDRACRAEEGHCAHLRMDSTRYTGPEDLLKKYRVVR